MFDQPEGPALWFGSRAQLQAAQLSAALHATIGLRSRRTSCWNEVEEARRLGCIARTNFGLWRDCSLVHRHAITRAGLQPNAISGFGLHTQDASHSLQFGIFDFDQTPAVGVARPSISPSRDAFVVVFKPTRPRAI